jgi:hypothetical protein
MVFNTRPRPIVGEEVVAIDCSIRSHNLAMVDASRTQHELFAQQSKSVIYQVSFPHTLFRVQTVD